MEGFFVARDLVDAIVFFQNGVHKAWGYEKVWNLQAKLFQNPMFTVNR
jgi:hypothetical protein